MERAIRMKDREIEIGKLDLEVVIIIVVFQLDQLCHNQEHQADHLDKRDQVGYHNHLSH